MYSATTLNQFQWYSQVLLYVVVSANTQLSVVPEVASVDMYSDCTRMILSASMAKTPDYHVAQSHQLFDEHNPSVLVAIQRNDVPADPANP